MGAVSRVPGPIVVLDDDPTGVQTLAGVRVLLSWDRERVRLAVAGRSAVHLITNTRALDPARVRPLVEKASRTVLEGVPDAHLVLRGDSTLRGHLLEEYLGVREVVAPLRWPLLILVPALPSAGRVTVDGVHLLERDGKRVPVAETEFARDGVFSYSSSRLLDWAEERSDGLFRADRGREVRLAELRTEGSAGISRSIVELSGEDEPAVLALDAETTQDLEAIAAGYVDAASVGAPAIVRCAPAFAGVLSDTTARAAAALPIARAGVLVVCGSYVEQTTRQLERLLAERQDALVEADVGELAHGDASAEGARLVAETSLRLGRDVVAVLATARSRPAATTSLEAGERIALGLARVVGAVKPRPSVVVAKGGITSALVLREGIAADQAEVVGPVLPGVSRWVAEWPDGRPVEYLVVPGNVGDDDLLASLVDALVRGSRP
jgi:uncharacterized protein YgbK (DUF1537 family)